MVKLSINKTIRFLFRGIIMKKPQQKSNTQVIVNEQTITDKSIESWSVHWFLKSGWSNETKRKTKVFTSIDDTKTFETILREKAEFLDCWMETKIERND